MCDTENRLTGVSGGANASFVYDGDGDRVKGTVNGVTTVYVGNYYEYNVSTGVATSYYYAGSTRVAMRQGSAVYYLFGDHLGSTSVSYRVSDGQTLTQRYYAWGGIRPGPNNALPTDYTFTGQKLDATGLMYYGARYYDSALGRFLSADTIVPSPGNPQTLNRYSYVLGNPLKYVDPTGHHEECSYGEGCGSEGTWTSPLLLPWDDPHNYVSQADRQKAEQAFSHFVNEPEYFVALSMDNKAWAGNPETAALEAFANNSVLHTTASDLVRAVVPSDASLEMGQNQYDFDLGKSAIGLSALGIIVYKGGAYGPLVGEAGIEVHHMPANSVSPISRYRGPAIQMEVLDHRATSSFGRGGAAYRQNVGELIEEGSMRDAMAVEIQDIRSRFGTKYNSAIQQMLEYAKGAGYLNKK
jgi:RHS repeat-associated protein